VLFFKKPIKHFLAKEKENLKTKTHNKEMLFLLKRKLFQTTPQVFFTI